MAAGELGGGPRRSWPQRLLIGFNVICVLAALLAAGALGWQNTKVAKIQRVSLGHALTAEPQSADDPQNYLLVGTDSSTGLSPDDPAVRGRAQDPTSRSDTIMILRVDPKANRAQLLSIPRDLWVPVVDVYGQQHGKQKINAAIEYGGPPALIRTIETNLQIPIHHYVQIDWQGFHSVVSALGGVPVYFDQPVKDDNTGLLVEQPGCVTLDPVQALAYVRSRHLYYFANGDWQPDTSNDFGRASRQRDFIQRAMKRAVAKGARNLATLNSLVNAGLKSVRIDENLTPGRLYDLGNKFSSFDPNNLQDLALPAEEGKVGDADVVFLLQDQAQPVLDLFRGPGVVGARPESVQLGVLNGSGASNQATDVSTALANAGFRTAAPGDAPTVGSQTVVRYGPGKEAKAALVARYLDASATYELAPDLSGADVVVVTGTDFTRVLASPQDPSSTRGPPTTVAPSTSVTTTTTTPITSPGGATTSVPLSAKSGVVPRQPPGVHCG